MADNLAGAFAEPNGTRATQLFSEFVREIQPDEFAASFRKVLASPKPGRRAYFLELLLTRWAELDPAAAAAALGVIPLNPPEESTRYATAIARTWATTAPTDAWRWLDSARQRVGLGQLPTLQTRLIDDLVEAGNFRGAATALVAGNAPVFYASVADRWTAANPADAARWISTEVPPAGKRLAAIEEISRALMNRDPKLARDTAGALASLADRGAAVTGILQGYRDKQDLIRDTAWLLSAVGDNPDGEFDVAINRYFFDVPTGPRSPDQEAAEAGLLGSIRSPNILGSTITALASKDVAAAERLASGAKNLPAEVREQLAAEARFQRSLQ